MAQVRQVTKRGFKHWTVKTEMNLLKKSSDSPSIKVSNDRSD